MKKLTSVCNRSQMMEITGEHQKGNDGKMRDSLKAYIESKMGLNLSDTTIRTYKSHISKYIAFVTSKFESEDTSECCNAKSYYDFLEYLRRDQMLEDESIASYARSIKAWLNWLMDRKVIAREHLQIPKVQYKIPETYTDEELKMLLKRPQNGCTYVHYMTWVMINVFVATGVRLSSLIHIKVRDFSFNECTLAVNTTKNSTPIKLPINKELAVLMNKYIIRSDLEPDDWLFCTGKRTMYAPRTVEDYVADYIRGFGIEKHRMIHAFRHTFAKNEYLSSHDIYKVKELLGHKSLAMTERYLRSLGCMLDTPIEYNPQRSLVDETPVRARHSGRINFDDDPMVNRMPDRGATRLSF